MLVEQLPRLLANGLRLITPTVHRLRPFGDSESEIQNL
jgi:hypothetical protein